MNFKDFQGVISSLENAKRLLGSIPYWCVTEAGNETFSVKRRDAVVEIDSAIGKLFEKEFPENEEIAREIGDFSFPAFFEMLKRHPEVAKKNKEKLESLLENLRMMDSLRTSDKEPTEIPKLEEFIKE